MKSFLINTLYNALRWYVSTGVFDRLSALVVDLIAIDIPGSQKKNQVIEFAANEFGMVKSEFNEIIIDAIISVTRLKDSGIDGPVMT